MSETLFSFNEKERAATIEENPTCDIVGVLLSDNQRPEEVKLQIMREICQRKGREEVVNEIFSALDEGHSSRFILRCIKCTMNSEVSDEESVIVLSRLIEANCLSPPLIQQAATLQLITPLAAVHAISHLQQSQNYASLLPLVAILATLAPPLAPYSRFMSRKMSKTPGTKKGKKGKEDMERQMREEDERLAAEELLLMEREAEDKQRLECEQRDRREAKEMKRFKKEQSAALLAEKEKCIFILSTQVNEQVRLFAQSRSELEDELESMGKHKDELENRFASLQVESKSTIGKLEVESRKLAQETTEQQQTLEKLQKERNSLSSELENRTVTLRRQVAVVEERLEQTEVAKEERNGELMSKIKNTERELEKTVALNRTLQEVIEAREVDDKKNVMLMQLLNNQLDENKKRSQQSLEAEKNKSMELSAKLAGIELSQVQLQDETDVLKRNRDDVIRHAERDLAEYKNKLEQVKFDARFVHHELSKYKTRLEHQQTDFTKRSKDSSDETNKMKTTLETAQQKIEELEVAIRKKDRDHFDKVTFFNAQIGNNRTIISQLQQKFQKEKECRLQEVAALHEELTTKNQRLSLAQADLNKKKMQCNEDEAKLQSDVAILKTTVFQLQSALVEKEREMDNLVSDKEEEVRRLRKKLDEHFIPHRGEVQGNELSRPLEQALNDKVQQLTRDLEIRSRVSLDTETRLNAQIGITNQVVEALQLELKAKDDQYTETIKVLTMENQRLKTQLENYAGGASTPTIST